MKPCIELSAVAAVATTLGLVVGLLLPGGDSSNAGLADQIAEFESVSRNTTTKEDLKRLNADVSVVREDGTFEVCVWEDFVEGYFGDPYGFDAICDFGWSGPMDGLRSISEFEAHDSGTYLRLPLEQADGMLAVNQFMRFYFPYEYEQLMTIGSFSGCAEVHW